MDVFLIPLGPDRHELYCEIEPARPDSAAGPRPSWWRRRVNRFREMLAHAEADRARADGEAGADAHGQSRVGRFVKRKIAEVVAEQRLLWHLRGQSSARLVHGIDLDGVRALAVTRLLMQQDYNKHRRKAVISGAITAVTGPLFFFVPGPNVISWYFAFRLVGHFYAMRGAGQGAYRVAWATRAEGGLSTVRAILDLPPLERRARLEELSAALGLDRFAAFVDRVAPRPS